MFKLLLIFKTDTFGGGGGVAISTSLQELDFTTRAAADIAYTILVAQNPFPTDLKVIKLYNAA